MIYSLVTLMTFTSGLVRFSALSHKLVDVCQTFQALVMMKVFFLKKKKLLTPDYA